MSPTFPSTNEPNRSATYTEQWTYPFSGQAGFKQRSDCENVVLPQLVDWYPFAARHSVPLYGVACVVGVGTKVEVGRIDTPLTVACVQDEQAAVDWSVREFKGDTMGSSLSAAPSQRSVTASPVPTVEMRAVELPAPIVNLDDSTPEGTRSHVSIIQVFQ